jgi:hypothetical protein
MHIPLYTGKAAPFARLAAYWLARESMWDGMGGPLQSEGKAFCRTRRARNLQLARETDELNRRVFAARNEALAIQVEGGL